jgi:hypothetical protein
MEIFRIEIRWALCSRWLSTVVGSYPGSNGEVRGGISGTPIDLRYSFVLRLNIPR